MKRNLSVIILASVLCTILACSVSAQERNDGLMYSEFAGKWKAVCNETNIGIFHFVNDGRLIINKGGKKILYGYIPAGYDDQAFIRETGIIGALMMQPNSGGMPEQWDIISVSKNRIELRTNVLDEVILSRIK